MIIYNITIKVNPNIQDEWLRWQKEEHIPKIMATGCFEKYQLSRVLGLDDTDGATFTVQFYSADRADYERYLSQYATKLRQDTFEKWGDAFVAFRSLMEVVH